MTTRQHATRRAIAAAAWSALVFATGCSSGPEHRWVDPDLGLDVRSDFPIPATAGMFDADLRARMIALQRLIESDSRAELRVYVHDRTSWSMPNDLTVGGWHSGGEIHVMAGWGEPKIGLPTLESRDTFLHEFVHALVARAGVVLPGWFEEGLCEVLSGSVVTPDGRLVWLPNPVREREVRQLRADGLWLPVERMTGFVDAYPDDPYTAALLYAQSTSFVWALVAERPPQHRAEVMALATSPAPELHRRFDAWRDALDTTSLVELFRPFAGNEVEAVRRAAVRGLAQADDSDPAYWQLAGELLSDPSPDVRAAMRIQAISRPARHALAVEQQRAWSEADDRELHLSGQLALAQGGDIDAGVGFCRELTDADVDWGQPLLWLILIVPAPDGSRRTMPVEMLTANDGALVRDAATRLANDLEAMRPRLRFDTTTRCYRLR